MGDVAKLLTQISWTDLALGIAVGLGLVGMLTLLAFCLLPRNRGHDDAGQHAREEEERRRLLCEDAKVLADLAIQRHMSDVAFLERFQAQPCYDALFAHFSEKFRERLTQPGRHLGRSDLAAACREECERLERQWRPG
ncbi:MAG TPA: hypothetical protein VN175_04470 [Rhizomicrobium sp.]|nr:hypothetical protein [Rhizomicrobium sp.]